MVTKRADASRNRSRILDASRSLPRDALRLNDVARRAGLGVATVYRHFPTTHALVEALATDTLLRMRDLALSCASDPDTSRAFRSFLSGALELLLEEGGLQAVLVSEEGDSEQVQHAKRELGAAQDRLLTRAHAEGVLRHDIGVEELQRLVCGLEHAVRLDPHRSREAPLDVLLRGVRP
ncbi:TetR/AcrR family transcriptional regulator [Aeromicrobium phragmitis]|uniref:TetR/AcrR family transcriptional regulator n=1 Tax=Aeromicrobium phragmitis TaxID=2478914 RepID=A0A3L8PP77_9ACTN|nr:TetR/AcrR family transcriptional regulator [Aeromicrobium phragmitis]